MDRLIEAALERMGIALADEAEAITRRIELPETDVRPKSPRFATDPGLPILRGPSGGQVADAVAAPEHGRAIPGRRVR